MQDELDDLADLPPEDFVSARNALSKRLKAEGKTGLAAEVRKLRKPTVPQWIADQVRRHEHGVVVALRVASSDVATAQEAVITGGEREVLRQATAKRREALHAVGRVVDEVLARHGRTTHHHDEVLSAIDAAVTAGVAPGRFGLRDDLEVPDRPKDEPVPDQAAERRAAEAEAAIEAAEARCRRAREELEAAESALKTVLERRDGGKDVPSPSPAP